MDYDRYCRAAADAIFATPPSDERAAIGREARALNTGRFGATKSSLANTIVEIARLRITARRYPETISALEQRKANRRKSQRPAAACKRSHPTGQAVLQPDPHELVSVEASDTWP
jgi:hypothetical protein